MEDARDEIRRIRALALRLTACLLSYPDERTPACARALAELFEPSSPEGRLAAAVAAASAGCDAVVEADGLLGVCGRSSADLAALAGSAEAEDGCAAFAHEAPLDLRTDYTALFIGAFEMLAPPYASYYLDGAFQLGGPTTVAVERCYRQCGMVLAGEPRRPGDHLATMLEFVSALLERGSNGDEDAAGQAASFCRAYLNGWVREFARLTSSRAKTEFYRSVGEFAAETLVRGVLLPDEQTRVREGAPNASKGVC